MRSPTQFSTDDEIIEFLKWVSGQAEKVHDGGNIWESHGCMRGHINGLIKAMEGRVEFLKQSRQEVRDLIDRHNHQRRSRRAQESLRDS